MVRLRVSAQARRDLQDISDKGVLDFGPAAAANHMNGFRRLFLLLREQPSAGQARPELGAGLRSLSHPPHRILYRLLGDTVVIYRVLHHAQDIRRVVRDEA